jgi:hypothetical protein
MKKRKMDDEEITNYMQILYLKEGNIENIQIPHNIVNKRISLYSPHLLKFCYALESGIYYQNSYYYYKVIDALIPKTKYYPKTKEVKEILENGKENKNKEDTFDFLYKHIVKHYNWGVNEEKMYKSYYFKLFEDKEILRYYYRYFDIPEKQWKNI